MRSSRTVLILVSLCFWPAAALAADVKSLEEAFENVVERLNEHDQDGFMKVWHPEAILIVYDYLFPVDRSDAGDEIWGQIFREFFTSTKITMTPVDVDFRVVGATGMVWGLTQTILEPVQGDTQIEDLRVSVTFVAVDGEWRLMSWHSSLPPVRVGRSGP